MEELREWENEAEVERLEMPEKERGSSGVAGGHATNI